MTNPSSPSSTPKDSPNLLPQLRQDMTQSLISSLENRLGRKLFVRVLTSQVGKEKLEPSGEKVRVLIEVEIHPNNKVREDEK